MEHIAHSIRSIFKGDVFEFVGSVHFMPVTLTAIIATALFAAGHPWLGYYACSTGLAVTFLGLWLLPIVTIGPLITRYTVGLRELLCTQEPATGAGCPPLAWLYPTLAPLKGTIRWLPFIWTPATSAAWPST